MIGPLSLAVGVISTLVVHWTSDRAAVRRATNLILAHILEFRLFLDEPAVILQAQWSLVKANVQLLRLMLLPALILAIPSFLVVSHLNSLYGRAPLMVGQAVVVSAQEPAKLNMPAGISIETPAVHSRGQIAWRVRASAAVPVESLTRSNTGIAIPFPAGRVLGLHWLVWFLAGFAIAAIGTKCLL
jgi:hypothetical protein